MSFSELKQIEYENIQKKKIAYFFTQIGDIDYLRADRYLSKANWDEKLAVKYFHDLHPNYIPPYVVQINPFSNNNKDLKPDIQKKNKISIQKNYLEINIDETLIKYSYKSILNTKYLESLSSNTKLIQKIFITFLKLLKNLGGVIIIFNEGSFNRLQNQIKDINEKNVDKNIIKKFVLFPLLDDTPLGKEFIKKLTIVSFPTYIFCKYINDKKIYVTDKMEGAFEISFFLHSIKKDIPNSEEIDLINKNYLHNHVNVKFENKKNVNENDFIDYNFSNKRDIGKNQNFINNNNDHQNNKYNNKYDDNKHELNDDLDIYLKNEKFYLENMAFINYNDEEKQINNLNQEKKQFNNNIKNDKKYDNYINENLKLNNYHEFDYNQNNINKKANPKNPIIKSNQNDKKENDLENYNLFEDDKSKNLLDSIYNLSDGQILAKREEEMKELERQQEEKEKKEKEEKRKEIEEEERKKKIEKKYEYEANIAKMILSEEPEENNPDICHIIFRFPDGEKNIERKFLKTDKIAVLYDFVKSIGREIFSEPDSNDFDIICLDFPPKNLEDKKSHTLLNEGLFPNSILQIREK